MFSRLYTAFKALLSGAERSNCNVFAWREFVAGRAKSMTLRLTLYSALGQAADHWAWRLFLRPVGGLLGAVGWALVQGGLIAKTGRWAHVYGGVQEFVPLESKYAHRVPPVLFEGEVRVAPECPTCGAPLRGGEDRPVG